MLSKLINAVLVLGLFLAFFGTAISGDNPSIPVTEKMERTRVNVSPGAKLDMPNYTPPLLRPELENLELGSKDVFQTFPTEVDTTASYGQYYCDDVGTSFWFTWSWNGGNGKKFATRYDVPENYIAQVDGIMPYFGFSQDNDADGGNTLVATVYEDDGGIPGAVIYTESYVLGDLAGGYYYFGFTTPPIIDAPTYHIGLSVEATAPTVTIDDTTKFYSDDGGHPGYGGTASGFGRCSYWSTSELVWYDNVTYFGFDPSWDMVGFQTIFYTECRWALGITPGYVDLWAVPDNDPGWPDGGTLNGMAQRFLLGAEGQDTLKTVRVSLFDYSIYGWDHYPTGSTNGIEVSIFPDDGTGNVDQVAGPIATEIVPGGYTYLFPNGYGVQAWQYVYVDFSSYGLILNGYYHVVVKTTSNDPADGQLVFTTNVGSYDPVYQNVPNSGGSVGFYDGGQIWERTGINNNWLVYGEGEESGYNVRIELCKDEFYFCETQLTYNVNDWWWGYGMYPGGGWDALAQRIKAPSINRIEKIRVQIQDPGYWGDPSPVTAQLKINIYEDAGTLPGAIVYSQLVDAVDFVYPPLFNEIEIPGGFIYPGNFYVGYECVSTDPADIFIGLTEENGDYINDGVKLYYHEDQWYDPYNDLGWGTENLLAEVDFCAVPIVERLCAPGDQWPTMNGGFDRPNASLSSLGEDAQGNLTKAWTYVQPTGLVSNLNSAVIYNDTVVMYFLDYLACIDINDGTEIWNKPHDGFHIGSGCYSTPTIFNFDAYGVTETYVFTAGGDAKAFTCFDITDGSIIWTKNFMFHSQHFMTYGPSVIVDVEGVPVIVYADDAGDVYALEALTGNVFSGWTVNPINLGGAILKGVSTDGVSIFIGIDANISNGAIFSVDAATGVTNWSFTDLQLCNLDAGNCGPEGFTGAIAYDVYKNVPTLFTASAYNQYVTYPPYNSGGIFYSIDATSGALNWASLCNAQDYCGPAIDAAHVINTGWNGWISSGLYRGPVAFSKTVGSALWSNTRSNPGSGPQNLADGMLSCETEKFDWFVIGNDADFLSFYNSDNGDMMFHRRMALGADFMHHYSPSMDDGHLLIGYRGKLFCLTEQEPRPRLDLPQYSIFSPVEFGSLDNHTVVFENAIGNMGGAPLTIDSVILGDDNNNTTPEAAFISVVSPDRVERIAEKYGSSAGLYKSLLSEDIASTPEDASTSVRSNSAYAYPAWIYGLTAPAPGTVVPPQGAYNDSSNYINIEVLINGSLVPRGLTPMYAYVYSDDPDYFLDSARIDGGVYAVPQILLGIVGGCLYDNVLFTFGVGSANQCDVYNSTKFLEDGINNSTFLIDDDDASFFQGALFFAGPQQGSIPPGKASTFSAKVAMHAGNWHTDPNNWETILPDQNCYDQTCAPSHRTNVLLGTISNDFGANYEDVFGEIVAYAFVDSVADMCEYDTLGNCTSWDWLYMINEGVSPPLRDTLTMGFHGCGSVFGAYDQALLNNFIIYKYDFSGRYGPVNDVYVGAMMDFDIGTDVSGYSEELSLAYDYDCSSPTGGWGMVKIPFGCGYEPMRGAKTIESQQGPWNDSDIWLDSLYYWLSQVPGLTHQTGAAPCLPVIDDRDAFFNIAELDMPQMGSGVLTLGIALFGLPDLENPDLPESYASLAHTANKWCGFGRGDVNNDNVINLVDIAILIDFVYYGGDGPYPFLHLGDVNADGVVDGADVTYMIDYYFNFGPCIQGAWTLDVN